MVELTDQLEQGQIRNGVDDSGILNSPDFMGKDDYMGGGGIMNGGNQGKGGNRNN